MMQDQYNGLTRVYTTAPVRAIHELMFRLEDLYAMADVSTDALKKHKSCETESIEIVLTRTTTELYRLQQEVKALFEMLDGSAGNE